MRWLLFVALVGCKSSDSKPAASHEQPAPAAPTAPTTTASASDAKAAPKPPDDMDERMRHCPVAIDGAVTTFEEIDGGVRFTIKPPVGSLDEMIRRAHHIVEFAAKKTRAGHGEFDGKGGGHMKNCPIVTDDVTITETDIEGGVQLDVVTTPDHVGTLRADTRERVTKFPFVGATITLATKH
jgi:hypothetical protein